jgi:hypothetical protein
MAEANVNDRGSVERAYPREAFDEDVRANMLPTAEVRHGVRIESGADAGGRFRLTRAAQQVGEDARLRHTIFLAPFQTVPAGNVAEDSGYGGLDERTAAGAAGDYDAFVNRIITAAREMEHEVAPGRGDDRLKGFRGG